MESFVDKHFQLSDEEHKKVKSFLKKENILLIGRYDAPTDYLAEYLIKRVSKFTLLKVSIDEIGKIPLLRITSFLNGRRVFRENLGRFFVKNYIASYLSVFVRIVKFLLTNGEFGIVVGVGPFNSWLSTFYRLTRPDSKTVYLCEDKVGTGGFDLKAKLTYWCDVLSKRFSSYIWFVSLEHLKFYKQKWLREKSIFVPQPVIEARLKIKRSKKIVFLGSVSKYQGADLLYRVFRRLVKTHKDLKLVIMGIGDYLPALKKIAENDGLFQRIEFMGFVTDRKKIFKKISESWLGVALYNPTIYKNLQYGQSAKICDYMGCRIPVITTGKGRNTPSLSKYILSFKTGFVCEYKEEAVYEAIKRLLKDKNLYTSFRRNTRPFAKMFNMSKIYPFAFSKLC